MLSEWLKLMLEEVTRKQSEHDAQRAEQAERMHSSAPAAPPPAESGRGDTSTARKRR